MVQGPSIGFSSCTPGTGAITWGTSSSRGRRRALSAHAIVVPFYLGKSRVSNGAGPEALVAFGVLNHLNIDRTTTVDVELQASNEIQQCVTIDAALARAASSSGGVPLVIS